jgi:two-component system alkaline phosphatase synthesis response regulator PhoP
MQHTILVVEDEKSIQHLIRTYLKSAGYRVYVTDNGLDALKLARQEQPDLIVLDLMLPGMDGMEVTARLREESDVYILMLTALGEETHRVAGLRMGADDYLVKPFSPRELMARIEAILRRHRQPKSSKNSLRFKHLSIDADRHEASITNQILDLTVTEFKTLLALARHAGFVLTREQLIEQVWGIDFYGTDRVVDVYVGQVRRKLLDATGERLIQTVRGVGYKFVDQKE